MPSYDDRTPSGWPLPFKSNTLEFDVERLRESFLVVDEALQALRENFTDLLDKKYYGLEEKQYILDARMDVIAGQTTEDSEILDARVDAEGVTHPNLGHNVRNLHSNILKISAELQDAFLEFQGLLKQFDELSYAQIQSVLASKNAHERRKQEIQRTNERIDEEEQTRQDSDAAIREELAQEQQFRIEQDEALQTQADELSKASLQNSLNAKAEAERRQKADEAIRRETAQGLADIAGYLNEEAQSRKASDAEFRSELAQEAFTRNEQDESLQAQSDNLSTASIRHSLDLQSEIDQRRKIHDALISESKTRAERDTALAAKTLQNTEDISDVKDKVKQEISDRQADIASEHADRLSTDEALQAQTDELSRASLQNSLNVKSEAEHRRKADEAIRSETAQGLADIAGYLNEEAQARAVSDAEIRSELAQEAFARIEQDETLQAQANDTAEAILRAIVHFQELSEKLKFALKLEEADRIFADDSLHAEINALAETIHKDLLTLDEILSAVFRENDEVLQVQADNLSKASLQHSLGLQNEIDQRRKIHAELKAESKTRAEQHEALRQCLSKETTERLLSEQELRQISYDEGLARISDDEAQQGQINSLAKAALRNTLDIQEEANCREAADNEEAQARILQGEYLQSEIESLSIASLRQNLNIHSDAEYRRKADETLQQSLADTREALSAEMRTYQDDLQDWQNTEAETRSKYDQVLQAQADDLAQASLQESINIKETADRQREALRDEAAKRESADSAETSIRSNDDSALQKQLDNLVFAVLRIALNDYEARERLRLSLDELFQVVADTGNFTYMGAKIASRSEIRDMLADVLSGSDSGEVSESEIPEVLQDKVASSSEVSDMLAEIFPNPNRS